MATKPCPRFTLQRLFHPFNGQPGCSLDRLEERDR